MPRIANFDKKIFIKHKKMLNKPVFEPVFRTGFKQFFTLNKYLSKLEILDVKMNRIKFSTNQI